MYDYGYNYTDYNTTSSLLGGLAAIAGIISIVSLVVGILMIVSQWIIYKKAGKKGWECIVPIYNIIVLIEIVELPMWYIALFFVPFANIYAMFKIYIELAHKFGKSTGFGVATAFFGFVCLPILAFGKNNVYNGGNSAQTVTNNMQNSQNPTIMFPNENNNMTNNSMDYNNANTQNPFMFDQNINTEINPIQNQTINNNNINNSQTNPITQSEMNQIPSLNPTTSIANSQPEVNVVPNIVPTVQPVESPILHNMDNQVPIVDTPQESTLKYETPTPVVTPQSETTIQNAFVNENQNVQPVTTQPQINVIPGMGVTPQPEVPNQNTGNNQNM